MKVRAASILADTGDRDVLTVAVNEGVGGAVEGQAAESVRIGRRKGELCLMAAATAPRRLVPQAKGDIAKLPTSGAETLLGPGEVRQLVAVAGEVDAMFPQLGEDGISQLPASRAATTSTTRTAGET